ncbi:hypothetical protein AJ80_04187 [Polytolypa hystricis UAMH7299]|uniref:Uncharacterized protein n=1 Tax=Polytolypa hystricis (strain UAMH7299) TaxID=1447883 RepID=A0A2B7YCF9_POLH7|nr:hypothetical protein AJ80_04187 [Polytolypa hystricis UAMH7299]
MPSKPLSTKRKARTGAHSRSKLVPSRVQICTIDTDDTALVLARDGVVQVLCIQEFSLPLWEVAIVRHLARMTLGLGNTPTWQSRVRLQVAELQLAAHVTEAENST